ncbi:MAG TPA: quercetin 2,3-dioxygenase [Terracidiphilus sp.]|nr:quercetin 2,3-dioxygenase [Terracidiphilus sp.]
MLGHRCLYNPRPILLSIPMCMVRAGTVTLCLQCLPRLLACHAGQAEAAWLFSGRTEGSRTMLSNELPAMRTPYKLDAGEGKRFRFGGHLATIIATPAELGQTASGTVLSGAKGAKFPLHRHQASHEAMFVLEGVVALSLAGCSYLLTQSDYVNIPAGTPHGYEFVDHRGKLLSWTFGGNAADAYERIGGKYPGNVYAETGESVDWSALSSGVDTELAAEEGGKSDHTAEKLTVAPEGMLPFVLAAGEGERMIAADQLYTILGNQTHSNGVFITLLTEGPIGPAIPRHQHEKVTELFHCLNGQMEMFAGDGMVAIDPGDFLHIPPRTPHSFQLKKHDTRFLGMITPGHFEPFFRYLCDPFEGYRYPLVPPPFRFDRVIQNLNELDLTILERLGGPPAGSAG